MPNPDNCATFFLMTSLFFPFFLSLTLSGLPITPELGYCRHFDIVERGVQMVGSELNLTRGKRGGIPGDIGTSSFPSSFCVASSSWSIFARSLTLIPRSLRQNHTETLASQAKSPLVFFPSSIFRPPSSIWTPGTSTWLFSILPLPGPRSLVMIGSCLCLFGCFCCFFLFLLMSIICHILHLRFFVVCSSPIRITLESAQIVPFSWRQSPLSTLFPLQGW